ncbi:hypothetical protein KBD45_06145 [Candidatus Dojkabacteria bacterium]|nr:hypothetical protein [Candidatus Dojkabacteria bacterium]
MIGSLGFIPFLMFEKLGIPYSGSIIYVIVTFILIISILYFMGNRPQFSFKDLMTYKLIIILFGLLILRNSFTPVRGWDAYSMYDGRARMLMSGLKFSDFAEFNKYEDTNYMYYSSYPPMTSVVHAVLYNQGFKTPMWIYGLFYFSYFVFIYQIIYETNINKYLKFGLTAIAVFNPIIFDQVNVAYTNLPALGFQTAALYLLIKFIKLSEPRYLMVSGILLGFSNWTRSLEPIYIAIGIALSITLFYMKNISILKKVVYFASFILIALIPNLIWSNYIKVNIGNIGGTSQIGAVDLISSLLGSIYLSNVTEVLYFIYTTFMTMKWYFIVFVVSLIGYYLNRKNSFSNEMIFISLMIFFIISIMFAGTLYFSVTYKWWNEIPGSFLRSNILLMPLMSIFAAMSLSILNYPKR